MAVTEASSGTVRSAMSAWTPAATTGPSPRATSIAYHVARQKTVFFGGQTSTTAVNNETWEWDGSAWAPVAVGAVKPSPRSNHRLAYDSARGVVVLFGGLANNELGDTWEYNGAWTQRASSGPSPRSHFAMAYDSARSVTVLFGGQGNNSFRGDTWEWNGTAWAKVGVGGPAPSPRSYPAMAYDPVRQVIVLFGGDANNRMNDTWEWDGGSWAQVSPSGPLPAARAGHAMTTYGSCGVVLYGGASNSGIKGDLWSFSGGSWVDRSLTGPAARSAMGLTHDSVRGKLVLFGGSSPAQGPMNDTWEAGAGVCLPDLWIKDSDPHDTGQEPNSNSPTLYQSTDIWVRTTPDTTISPAATNPGLDSPAFINRYYANEHDHENPVGSNTNYVYAKVRNRGATPSNGTELLRLYWADASTGITGATSSWNEMAASPVLLPVIQPGYDYVGLATWVPPNPFPNDHFCLLARIETGPGPTFGMSYPEGLNLGDNVAFNNNIAWKNVTVVYGGEDGGESGGGTLIVRNTYDRPAELALHFAVPAEEVKDHILMEGTIEVDLGKALMAKWKEGRRPPEGFEVVGSSTRIRILSPRVELGGLKFAANEEHWIKVVVKVGKVRPAKPGKTFNWDITQLARFGSKDKLKMVGGERYLIKLKGKPRPLVDKPRG